MKLNRTREWWADVSVKHGWGSSIPQEAKEDLATLFAEVDRLTAQLAARKGIARELAAASKLMVDWANGLATNGYPGTEMGKALARFHDAEGE